MPKSSRTSKKSTAAAVLTSTAEPKAGLPAFKDYGLKPRKQYLPWKHATERLEKSRSYWIVTAGGDGRPHAMPVWGFWLDDTLYFGTGRKSRKWRNLEANPRIVVHLESGDDVVIVEGTAREVRLSKSDIARLKPISQKKYGMWMPPNPKENVLVAVKPRKAFAWTEKDFPNNATRWVFN